MLSWSDEGMERVWQLTSGHPYLTQQLCSHVWEHAWDEEPNGFSIVQASLVEAVIDEALRASRNSIEWLWDGLPPASRIVSAALATAGTGLSDQEKLELILEESGVRVIIRELQDAPKLLCEWDILESDKGAFRFRVELLRRWIEENKPLARVQDELDHIEPVADSLYKAGLGLYRVGDLENAEQSLSQALGLNPNHVRATQLLADLLAGKEKWEKALTLLQRLNETHPVAARSRMLDILLKLSETHAGNDEEKARDYIEQALKLSPDHEVSQNAMRSWWGRKAELALKIMNSSRRLKLINTLGMTKKSNFLRLPLKEIN